MERLDREFYKELGHILHKARIKAQISYDSLSAKIGNTKTKSTLWRYEVGESKIDKKTLDSICKVLGIDPKVCVEKAKRLACTIGNVSIPPCELLEESMQIKTDYAISQMEAVSLGLKLKQEYLENGLIPRNLPHKIFLVEDINSLDQAIEALKKNLLD